MIAHISKDLKERDVPKDRIERIGLFAQNNKRLVNDCGFYTIVDNIVICVYQDELFVFSNLGAPSMEKLIEQSIHIPVEYTYEQIELSLLKK